MNIDRDGWLSEIFGYDVFKLSLNEHRPSAPDVREAVAEHQLLRPNGFSGARAFYYARVPTGWMELVQALTQSGFGVVDVNVTFEYRPPSTLLGTGAKRVRATQAQPIAVREISPAEHQAVLDIAGSCFAYSRFHLDPEIPTALAHAIKRAWVESYLKKKRGEKLLVALQNQKPLGFLALLAANFDGEPCRVIDLIGVDRERQGRGVGKALMRHLMSEAAATGGLLRVGTQAANLPSLRLYEALGFRTAETAYVLHSHMKPTRCLG